MNNSLPSIVLEARAITKEFPGVKALDNVEMRIYAGKVNAIVGENGAGKSTLMNIISGVYNTYNGDLLLDGQKVSFTNTTAARKSGISMIYQELNLIPHLSVAENIFLGREPLNRAGAIDYASMRKKAIEILDILDFSNDVNTPVSKLRVGQQQIVEIAKAISFDARVLIMDEPTSALTEHEVEVLFRLIRSLKEKGVAIVYITHKMDELTQLADYVTVMRDGKFIGEHEVKHITVDEIVKLMVGREPKDFFIKQSHPKGRVMFEVENMTLTEPGMPNKCRLCNVSFKAHASEVLGIYGLMGAGRTELFETIFGVHPTHSSGKLRVEGVETRIKSPSEAIKHGIALIPEDRKHDGLILGMNIAENISLASIAHIIKRGFMNKRQENREADEYRERLNIKSYSAKQDVGKLSGGNQQKVVLSKWLITKPKILLLDEPTRGIDINAKNEIYKLIDELAGQGMSIIVVSSELPEIMAISDRIITLCNGTVTGEFAREEFKEERILKASLPKAAGACV